MSNQFFSYEKDETYSLENDAILLEDNFMPKLPEDYRMQLEKEWLIWRKENSKKINNITEDKVKESLVKDLSFLCSMTSEEYTLRRKWLEIHREYPYNMKQEVHRARFFDGAENLPAYELLEIFKHNIWTPNDINDYKKIQPEVIWTKEDSKLIKEWNTYRTFLSTMINNPNIGRNLYFIIRDKVTGKCLGIMALSSDFLDLTPRDNYIGWSRESKTQGRMINHTGIGSTIVPTQPLGYNYVGGKLIALLIVSKPVEDAWNELYDRELMPSKLVGITTTALYSSLSQYTGLKYWNHLGHSAGSIKFEPLPETIELVKLWLKKFYPRRYWEWYVATEPQGMPLKRDYKQRSLSFAYNKLGIDKKYYETNHARGIYFCPLFTNTKEYLRREIREEQLLRRFDNSVESLVELWRDKYASKRAEKLLSDGRLNLEETLFYDDIIKMSWEETKDKYLKDVGR